MPCISVLFLPYSGDASDKGKYKGKHSKPVSDSESFPHGHSRNQPGDAFTATCLYSVINSIFALFPAVKVYTSIPWHPTVQASKVAPQLFLILQEARLPAEILALSLTNRAYATASHCIRTAICIRTLAVCVGFRLFGSSFNSKLHSRFRFTLTSADQLLPPHLLSRLDPLAWTIGFAPRIKDIGWSVQEA